MDALANARRQRIAPLKVAHEQQPSVWSSLLNAFESFNQLDDSFVACKPSNESDGLALGSMACRLGEASGIDSGGLSIDLGDGNNRATILAALHEGRGD